MKLLKYLIIFFYYFLFSLLLAKTEAPFFNSLLFVVVYIGLAPVVLMLIENIKTSKDKIKDSMWFGFWLVITDFIFRTIIINRWDISQFFFRLKAVKRMISGYRWYSYLIDLLKGSLLFMVWILIVVALICLIKVMIQIYKKSMSMIVVSVIKTIVLGIVFMGYMYLLTHLSPAFEQIQAEAIFNIVPIGLLRMAMTYMIMVVLFVIISYAKNQSVDLKRMFHLAFVIYLGYIVALVIFITNPLFWKIVIWLLEQGSMIVAFQYYFSTVIGIVLTLATFIITRNKNERSQDVLFSYKAILVLIYMTYMIFVLK